MVTDTNSLVPPEGAREHRVRPCPLLRPPALRGSHFPENTISSPPAAQKTWQDLPHPLPALTSSLSSRLTLLQQHTSLLGHSPAPGPLHGLFPLPRKPVSWKFPHRPLPRLLQVFVPVSQFYSEISLSAL